MPSGDTYVENLWWWQTLNETGRMKKPQRIDEEIPDGITRVHVLEAMADFDKSGLPSGYQKSIRYDVINEGRRYPPPAIMALAINRLSGSLPPGIRGGKKTKCFDVLRACGFEIVTKKTAAKNE